MGIHVTITNNMMPSCKHISSLGISTDWLLIYQLLYSCLLSWVRLNLYKMLFKLLRIFEFISGAWSDRNGRQFSILMGISALMIGYCFAQSILYSYSVSAPMWIWIITTFFEVWSDGLLILFVHKLLCFYLIGPLWQLSAIIY